MENKQHEALLKQSFNMTAVNEEFIFLLAVYEIFQFSIECLILWTHLTKHTTAEDTER